MFGILLREILFRKFGALVAAFGENCIESRMYPGFSLMLLIKLTGLRPKF